MKEVLLRACVVVRTSSWRNLRRTLVDYAKETHIRNMRFPTFSQSYHSFVALSLLLPLSFLKLHSDRKRPQSFWFLLVTVAPVAEKLWGP